MTKPISEIKKIIKEIVSEDDPRLQEWLQDPRKGVQQAVQQWYKAQEKMKKEQMQFKEMLTYETGLWTQGIERIAGIDEVGRGPLAGPVVAAAVVLPSDVYLPGINDSKKLSASKRERFYDILMETADVGIGIIPSSDIDRINIYEATKLAMIQALGKLNGHPEYLLIDAMELNVLIRQTSLIKGDAKSASIAAASIIAKVTRDRLMKKYSLTYPHFGFDKNMGYGTKEHLAGLREFGPCPIHRTSFSPVKEMMGLLKN
ncbi:ribonuclease HII [Bacillus xiapuensis]|uniref:ribonuclease HII n=1 Tax=Bacillus xiapuensis TaxID=2014075 RepID=UPI000C24F857|nr:ribonuclease HII [Bacillus xiapuensis]